MITSILFLASFGECALATNADFALLKDALKSYVSSNPRHIPLLVRSSFHDLVNFDPADSVGGPHGCLLRDTVMSMSQNTGLSKEVNDLANFVKTNFPQTDFAFGDVISLAGKVSIESSYPCVQIAWKFGRKPCTSDEPQRGPGGHLQTLQMYQPFLARYGFSVDDFAVLTAGAHGLAHGRASNANTGYGDSTFSSHQRSSGKQWIIDTLNMAWKLTSAKSGKPQFINEKNLRVPSDMAFFPKIIQKVAPDFMFDRNMNSVQEKLTRYVSAEESVFNADFARVYAKMLEIGTQADDLTPFVEPGVCLAEVKPTPPVDGSSSVPSAPTASASAGAIESPLPSETGTPSASADAPGMTGTPSASADAPGMTHIGGENGDIETPFEDAVPASAFQQHSMAAFSLFVVILL